MPLRSSHGQAAEFRQAGGGRGDATCCSLLLRSAHCPLPQLAFDGTRQRRRFANLPVSAPGVRSGCSLTLPHPTLHPVPTPLAALPATCLAERHGYHHRQVQRGQRGSAWARRCDLARLHLQDWLQVHQTAQLGFARPAAPPPSCSLPATHNASPPCSLGSPCRGCRAGRERHPGAVRYAAPRRALGDRAGRTQRSVAEAAVRSAAVHCELRPLVVACLSGSAILEIRISQCWERGGSVAAAATWGRRCQQCAHP